MVPAMFVRLLLSGALAALSALPLSAEAPRLLDATAVSDGATWTVSLTLVHADSGWDHYASGVKVLAPDGTLLVKHDIAHPHEPGVPFTEVVSGIAVAKGTDHILVRLRCTLDGWEAQPHRIDLAN